MHIIFYLAREKYQNLGGTHNSHTTEYLAVVAVGAETAHAVVATLSLCFCGNPTSFSDTADVRRVLSWQLHLAGTEGGRGVSDPQPDLSVPPAGTQSDVKP